MDDWDELRLEIQDLRHHVDELESSSERSGGCLVVYAMGMAIAIVLSWSRNGSILWCMLHGFFSWGYVIYFAFTR